MVSNQPDLVAKLFAIEIQGLQERHFDLSADTFVTVSVDGEQQVQTEVVVNDLNPTWKFKEPYNLMVHASSVISFQVYRRRHVAKVLGDKYIGELEQKLYIFVTNPNKPFDIRIRMNTMHWEKAQLMAVLQIDYNTRVEDLLDHAEDKMHGAINGAQTAPTAEALVALGHAIGSLDQLVGFVDGIVEIHPIAKAAWMLLSSVYKSFKFQAAQDSAIKELASSLMETLTHARSCRNVKDIPGAKNAVQELARLTAESASLLDECIKHTIILRTAKSSWSKTLQHRINDCDYRLKKLRKTLMLVLVIDINNKVHDIREDMRPNPAAEAPTPDPQPRQILPTTNASRPLSPPPPNVPRPMPPAKTQVESSQSPDIHPVGYNYQPIYRTSPDTYYTPLAPVRATSPVPIFTSERRAPISRPVSPWLPPLDTSNYLTESPRPMPRPLQPCSHDSYHSPPNLSRPFPMPSPSSSLSSMSCFSMEDGRTAPSQSSFPATPFDEEAPGQILSDQFLVEEPEDGLCCDHVIGCERSQSFSRQKEVQRQGFAMLWGTPNDMARSLSS